MAPLRSHLAQGASLWASALLTATLVTCLHLGLRAWALPLAEQLALYPLLLALPCLACEQLLPQTHRYRQLCRGLGCMKTTPNPRPNWPTPPPSNC
ncbi:hypothetical protein WR25_22774 [Diploscapter pachys]|uniref:Uncharacterized protein n=1 Tax=Diploscapter pachys TaxID=2018661 RepID=A0A2A2KHN7_9BILA|nr:hypothetical protein WR25_22774 [Diploscapter pachys]